MKHAFIAAAATALLVAGCTSTPKVAVSQPGDRNMSCSELEAEFAQLQSVQDEAENNQGVNTANVTAVLFFWPAAVGNYMEAGRAMDLVEERRAHLMDIYDEKGCQG